MNETVLKEMNSKVSSVYVIQITYIALRRVLLSNHPNEKILAASLCPKLKLIDATIKFSDFSKGFSANSD
jgi:hypothetical protein